MTARGSRSVLDRTNTASDVWADTAYRSAKNEAMLARRGFVSRIHRKKPQGRPMPERMRIANAQKSKVRSAVEHVFAHQKGPMGLIVRTIGIARARVKIGTGQSRLQHAPLRLADDKIRGCMTPMAPRGPSHRKTRPKPSSTTRQSATKDHVDLSRTEKLGFWRSPGAFGLIVIGVSF